MNDQSLCQLALYQTEKPGTFKHPASTIAAATKVQTEELGCSDYEFLLFCCEGWKALAAPLSHTLLT